MAYQVRREDYWATHKHPTFMPGRNTMTQKYHNVGQLKTPYKGKRFGCSGDYGPVQTSYASTLKRSACGSGSIGSWPYPPFEHNNGVFSKCGYAPEEMFCFGQK